MVNGVTARAEMVSAVVVTVLQDEGVTGRSALPSAL